MDFSAALSELWVLVGELLESLVAHAHQLAHRVDNTPQFWTWVSVWLGLFWICLRWIKIAKEANERRIFEAAEARLSSLVDETGTPHFAMDDQLVLIEDDREAVHSLQNTDSSWGA